MGIGKPSVPSCTVPVSSGLKFESHPTSAVASPSAIFKVGVSTSDVNSTCAFTAGAPLPATTVRLNCNVAQAVPAGNTILIGTAAVVPGNALTSPALIVVCAKAAVIGVAHKSAARITA